MRKQTVFLCILSICLCLPAMAFAVPVMNSGEYMFTIGTNDPTPNADLSDFELMIENWFLEEKSLEMDIDLEFYAKVEAPGDATSEGGAMSVDYYDNKAGTWETDEAISFYSVKAGSQYALYWLDPETTSGYWSTEDLFVGKKNKNPDLSHISTWIVVDNSGGNGDGGDGGTGDIPEPATVFLIGSALIGLAGARKRFTKRS